ncbi:MAG: histidine--tRNA ligase [Pseudomonadota bacterium]
MVLKSPKGTRDLVSNNYSKFKIICDFISDLSQQKGYEYLETPIFELSDVFIKNLGDTTDIIKKEIYCLVDKGKEKLVLRPEFTAGVVRAFITNKLHLKNAGSFFSLGPLFRYDRPQAGRYRQFYQANFEKIGFSDRVSEIELLLLGWKILSNYLNDFVLYINHLGNVDILAQYKKIVVDYFLQHKSKLSLLSQERIFDNPLRILDSKNDIDQQVVKGAPKICELYTDEVRQQFEYVLKQLDKHGVNYIVDHTMVRGLDYYTGLIFEFKDKGIDNAQNTILAGGRYDHLVSQMTSGKVDMPAIGMALGLDRLVLSANKNLQVSISKRFGIVAYTHDQDRILDILDSLDEVKILVSPMHFTIDRQFKYMDDHNILHAILIYDDVIYYKNLSTGDKVKIDDLRVFINDIKF